MKNKTFKRIVYRGKVRFRICPRCGGTGTFNSCLLYTSDAADE